MTTELLSYQFKNGDERFTTLAANIKEAVEALVWHTGHEVEAARWIFVGVN